MKTEIEILKRKLERERAARIYAEKVLEEKALALFDANEKLLKLNQNLEYEAQLRADKLYKSEQQYRQLVENVDDIIFKTTPNGQFTFVNQVAVNKTKYSEDELLKMNFIQLIHPDYVANTQEYYIKKVAQKKTKSYFEFPILSKNNEEIWIGQNVQYQFENNTLTEVFAVARDITAFKNAHEQIILSEEKYRSIIENLDLGLLETDINGIITKVYPKFSELTGYKSEELIGKNPTPIFLDTQEEINQLKNQEKERRKGISGAYETSLKKKNGEKIWVLISAAPIQNRNGKVTGTIGVHFNITERKKIEEDLKIARQEAENARKAEQAFLANMSHEIRTPLNAVIGMAHLLYDQAPTEEQIEYLNALKHSANVLKAIINDILDISKIEAGKLEYFEESFDIEELVKTLFKTFELKVQGKPITVLSEIDPRICNKPVLGDQLLLNQVLFNLLGNAEKFTSEGEIGIDLHVRTETENDITVEFWIFDTGIGIEKDRQELIFEKYEQINQKTKYKYGGTGLGLAITKKIVDFLNGSIEVESEIDRGSIFKVILTFNKSNQFSGEFNQNLKSKDRLSSKTYKNVLVVEDNAMNRKYIHEIFKKSHLKLEYAHDGAVAIEMTKNKVYDIILMDLQMPEKDGFEATIAIRKKENPNNNTPIVGLSAFATEDVKNKTALVGMDLFISKPFTPKQLRDLLNIESKIDQSSPTPIIADIKNPIDYALLEELYFGDIEYAYEMFSHFLQVIDAQIQELNDALNEANWNESRRLIHKMKPGFSMVGLPKLQTLGTELEHACEGLELEKIHNLSQKLLAELNDNIFFVQEEFKNLKAKL